MGKLVAGTIGPFLAQKVATAHTACTRFVAPEPAGEERAVSDVPFGGKTRSTGHTDKDGTETGSFLPPELEYRHPACCN